MAVPLLSIQAEGTGLITVEWEEHPSRWQSELVINKREVGFANTGAASPKYMILRRLAKLPDWKYLSSTFR